MNARLPTGLVTLGLLFAGIAAIMPSGAAAATSPISFGMDSASISAETAAGVKPDYGTFWIGPWTLNSGWAGPDNELGSMAAQGITPAVHFYYWGDDITPSCVENGCWSSLHNAQKTRAGWQTLGDQLVSHMNAKMGGKPVVVFLESEFNKGGISTYEPFDGYMADMANHIHQGYPNATIVLGFGNWDSGNWKNFDRAAAASDLIGLQGMRGSTRDSATSYNGIYNATLSGVKLLQTNFGKPIMLTDIALSSYPEPGYLTMQSDNLATFFAGLPALKAAGVTAMVYRSWSDVAMDPANYYGLAEQHWGLAYSASNLKAAANVWVAGVKAERATPLVIATTITIAPITTTTTTVAPVTTTIAPTTTTTTTPVVTTTTTAPYTATFAPTASVNAWWVDVKVTASSAPTKVEAITNGVSHTLAKTSWGTYASSFSVPKGTMLTFKATSSTGATALSAPIAWLGATTTTTTMTTAATTTTVPAPTTLSAFTASFSPKSVGNNWWVESGVTANKAITKVQAKINGGAAIDLPKDSWGTYAKSINAPNNSKVVFVATATSGQTVTSPTYIWT